MGNLIEFRNGKNDLGEVEPSKDPRVREMGPNRGNNERWIERMTYLPHQISVGKHAK